MKDYYYLLGVDRRSSDEDIKKAYRKLSLKLHPDQNDKDDEAFFQQRFLALQEAYQTLSDPDRRLLYNMELELYHALQKKQRNSNPIADDAVLFRQRQELQSQNEQLNKREQQLLIREQSLQEQEIRLRNEQIALRNQQEQFLRLQNDFHTQQHPTTPNNAQQQTPIEQTLPITEPPNKATQKASGGVLFKTFWFLIVTAALIALPLWFNAGSHYSSNDTANSLIELNIKRTISSYYKTLQDESPHAAKRFFADSTFVLSSQPNDTLPDKKPISYYLQHLPCRWEIDWSHLKIEPQPYQSYRVSYKLLLYPKNQPIIAQPLYTYQAVATMSSDFKISQLTELMLP